MNFKIPDTPEELFGEGRKKIQNMNFNKWGPFFVIVIVVLGFLATSFYSVGQGEVGVIRLFGKYSRTTEPGLHWKIPFGIEKVDIVPVRLVYKEEFGFRTKQPGVKTTYSQRSYDDEALMLTGDLNVLDVSWVIQFRIKDPVKMLFKIRQPQETVRDLSEALMRQVIGDHSVSEALTVKKNAINVEVKKKLQNVLDRYESGIMIDKVELQEVLPPKEVSASFNEVNEAEQDKEKVINQAWEAYNKIIPKARGQAKQVIREAEGYALAKEKTAQGDAAKFLETWKAYTKAKRVTEKRLYLETLENILPEAGKLYVLEPETTSVLPLLKLNEGVK
jgi:membrane protease subunit HflK